MLIAPEVAPAPKDPVVLSYLALRQAVGIVAVGLPFALALPWIIHTHILASSISGYYHTGMRNLFVGSLCAISMFMLSNRGYDRRDEIAGAFSALCALGVAFFPTEPGSPTPHQRLIGIAHYGFAALLFSTLAYFCLVLFRMTAAHHPFTIEKRRRNTVYTACGFAIIASMVVLAGLATALYFNLPHVEAFIADFHTTFCFETTSLIAFGIAWLVKGGTFLADIHPAPFVTRTTDGHVMVEQPPTPHSP